jgi:hypothetical protein
MLSQFHACERQTDGIVFEHNASLGTRTSILHMTMHNTAFLFALLFATQAAAAEISRCGTDAFGNDVCIDKDGVQISAPLKPAGDRSGGKAGDSTAPARSTRESGSKADHDKEGRARCGVDPFGNEVCRW